MRHLPLRASTTNIINAGFGSAPDFSIHVAIKGIRLHWNSAHLFRFWMLIHIFVLSRRQNCRRRNDRDYEPSHSA